MAWLKLGPICRFRCFRRGLDINEGIQKTMKQAHTVQEEYKDLRLDVYLANTIPEVPSRMFIKKMIEAGQVKVNGRQEKVKYKVSAGDQMEADVNAEAWAPKDITAEKMDLDIFYEDDDLAVINKPEGLTVHPAS